MAVRRAIRQLGLEICPLRTFPYVTGAARAMLCERFQLYPGLNS
jgi:hypothetical protein